MFNPQKCDRITTISISLSMVKSLQPGVRLAPACPCRCSARRDWDGTAGLSGNLPIVKNGLGGKEKTSLHIICVLKKSLVLFQQMHWRGTQSCWYNWYDIYIIILYIYIIVIYYHISSNIDLIDARPCQIDVFVWFLRQILFQKRSFIFISNSTID